MSNLLEASYIHRQTLSTHEARHAGLLLTENLLGGRLVNGSVFVSDAYDKVISSIAT